MGRKELVDTAKQRLRDIGCDAKTARELAPKLANRWKEGHDRGYRHPNNPLTGEAETGA